MVPQSPAATELGLLLDVDGPLASPVARSVRIPSILDDLVALVAAGVPVAFVTGRSDAFVGEQLVRPLLAHGLAGALGSQGTRLFGVFEKGGAWAPVGPDGLGRVEVDPAVALDRTIVDAVAALVSSRFAETMFVDTTKRAMISVEQRIDVDADTYAGAQPVFIAALESLARRLDLGLRTGDDEALDSAGRTPYRIDPTIIAVDLESARLGKRLGARRALDHFAELGPLPDTWRTVGDSRTDYDMADHLHERGFGVRHLDVRPGDGPLPRPYPVDAFDDLADDEAGAAFLSACRERIGA
ncbi:hypothetical protein F8O01_03330 [Pseudoclavibacter chungangensis]|uniref:HAD family phosphatase n=1 Tax=Pseudoclavibacter chungangensis TaxID=587635 RepID=A0A7J5C0T2_9MICO|nr:hypothetical protein [Pseudoclavibacter chungangensis]KAB1660368.1 hypothetical protein F8O01_03330 [Pseudoclavibacter chungangensis]NYJ65729.1 hypothetical protein [Pseudoclavibacter chungangensis]